MKRRTFLTQMALGGLALGCSSDAATRRRALGRLGAGAAGKPAPGDLEHMADVILATDAGDMSAVALDWLDAGHTERDILSASYLAGLREINPSPIGGQVHALMVVASVSAAIAALPVEQRPLPLLFHLHRIKLSVGRDERRGDWTMPSAPEIEPAPRSEHLRAFRTAMERWDEPAGDRATVALHDQTSLREFFEELWPWAARDFRVIGHKMIFATQTFRAIEDLGWRLGCDAVRAVVLGILDQNPFGRYRDEESKRILALFDSNRERLGSFPEGWRIGRDDPAASFALMERLREVDAAGASDVVLAALDKGVGERCIWDGLRLTAFELAMRHPNIPGVHPVTSINALWRGSLITDREPTRRLCVLQAAGWMVLFRTFLAEHGTRDLRIEGLAGTGKKGRTADPFAASDEAAAMALARAQAAEDPRAFIRGANAIVVKKAQHDHDYKYTIAAVEEIAAAHPACQPALAAASMANMRLESAADHVVVADWERSRR